MKSDTRGWLRFKVEKPSCLVQSHATSGIKITNFSESEWSVSSHLYLLNTLVDIKWRGEVKMTEHIKFLNKFVVIPMKKGAAIARNYGQWRVKSVRLILDWEKLCNLMKNSTIGTRFKLCLCTKQCLPFRFSQNT